MFSFSRYLPPSTHDIASTKTDADYQGQHMIAMREFPEGFSDEEGEVFPIADLLGDDLDDSDW